MHIKKNGIANKFINKLSGSSKQKVMFLTIEQFCLNSIKINIKTSIVVWYSNS